MNLAAFLISAGIVLMPFYVFPSGLPQPAHFFFLCGACVALAQSPSWKKVFSSPVSLLLLSFVLYVCLVNLINAILVLTVRFADPAGWGSTGLQGLHFSLFYIFNFVIFLGVLCYGVDERTSTSKMWSQLMYAVLLSLAIQTVLSLLGLGRKGTTGLRTLMFFNNPNQLAYFSLCAATLLFLAQSLGRQSAILVFSGYILALYISLLALSKGALLGIGVFPLLYMLVGETSSPRRIFVVCAAAAVLVFLAGVVDQELFTNLERRLADFGTQGDDSLAARGYGRIFEFPVYTAFGAGEGFRFRFNTQKEIHSLFATVLFSYGIVGLALVAAFVARLVKETGLGTALFFLPIAVYNLTHNGIRSPFLWMMFALIIVAKVRSAAWPRFAEDAGTKRSPIGDRRLGV